MAGEQFDWSEFDDQAPSTKPSYDWSQFQGYKESPGVGSGKIDWSEFGRGNDNRGRNAPQTQTFQEPSPPPLVERLKSLYSPYTEGLNFGIKTANDVLGKKTEPQDLAQPQLNIASPPNVIGDAAAQALNIPIEAVRGAVSAVKPVKTPTGDLDIAKTAGASALEGVLSPDKVPSFGGQIQKAYPATNPWVSGTAGTALDLALLHSLGRAIPAEGKSLTEITQEQLAQHFGDQKADRIDAIRQASKGMDFRKEIEDTLDTIKDKNPDISDKDLAAARNKLSAVAGKAGVNLSRGTGLDFAERIFQPGGLKEFALGPETSPPPPTPDGRGEGALPTIFKATASNPVEADLASEPTLTPSEKEVGTRAAGQTIDQGLTQAAQDPRPTAAARTARIQEIEALNHDQLDDQGNMIRPAQIIPASMAIEAEQHKQALQAGDNKPSIEDIHNAGQEAALQAIEAHRQHISDSFKDFAPQDALDRTGEELLHRHTYYVNSYEKDVYAPISAQIEALNEHLDNTEDLGQRAAIGQQIKKLSHVLQEAGKGVEENMNQFQDKVLEKGMEYASGKADFYLSTWKQFHNELMDKLGSLQDNPAVYKSTVRQTVDSMLNNYANVEATKQANRGKVLNAKSVYSRVIQMGGINPASIKAAGYNVDEDFRQNGLGFLLRKSGMDFSKIAAELTGNNEIPTHQEGASENDSLMKVLKAKESLIGKEKESDIERYEREEFERIGGPAYKLVGLSEKEFQEMQDLEAKRIKKPWALNFEEATRLKELKAQASVNKVSPVFYSQLEKAIEEKMPKEASVNHVRGILASSGIPKEQLDWVGVDQFVEGNEKVSKKELLDFIRANDVKVEEIEKGKPEFSKPDILKLKKANTFGEVGVEETYYVINKSDHVINRIELMTNGKYRLERDLGKTVYSSLEDAQKTAQQYYTNSFKEQQISGTKFHGHTLPGGENYKELLLTLPTKPDVTDAKGTIIHDNTGQFNSSHFVEPNVLAHVRFNTRIDKEGRLVLFIEEIQSDWHQKGRKEGYGNKGMQYVVRDARDGSVQDRFNTEAEAKEAIKGKEYLLYDSYLSASQSVPNAPFKKTWHELALKRMLRYAAENGYEKMAWTTGEQQAERYDLSKSLDEIEVFKKPSGKVTITGKKGGEQILRQEDVLPEKLSDVVGKDLAEKIIAQKYPEDKNKTYSGVDLKVGGEGMKTFYDQMIPSFLNKYAKKWDAKVADTRIETPDGTDESGKEISTPKKFHSIEITPAMRESVIHEGQKYKLAGKLTTGQQIRAMWAARDVVAALAPSGTSFSWQQDLYSDEGMRAVGMFEQFSKLAGRILLDPTNPRQVDVAYHEIVHAVLRTRYSSSEAKLILGEVMDKWGIKNLKDAEEELADRINDYRKLLDSGMNSDKAFQKLEDKMSAGAGAGGRKLLSERLKEFIRAVVRTFKRWMKIVEDPNDKSLVKVFYDDVLEAKRAKRPVPIERPVESIGEIQEEAAKIERAFKEADKKYGDIQKLMSKVGRTPLPETAELKKQYLTLYSGFDPGVDKFIEHDVVPTVQKTKEAAVVAHGMVHKITAAFMDILEPAKAVEKNLGEEAYAQVIRAIHAPDRALEEFYSTESKVMLTNFKEAEKFFDKFKEKDLQNFMLSRGFPSSMGGMQIQSDALKDLPKALKNDDVQKLMTEAADFVFAQAKKAGLDIHYMKDYYYGIYKNGPGGKTVDSFLDHWKSTDRYLKTKAFPTYADAAAWGLVLRDFNPIRNIASEMRAVAKVVGLLDLKTKTENSTFAVYTAMASPGQMRLWSEVKDPVFRGMLYHPDFAKLVNNLIEISAFSKNEVLAALRNLTYGLQQIKFLGSIFHQGNMMKAAIAEQSLGVFNPTAKGFREVMKGYQGIDVKDPIYLDYLNIGGGHKYSNESQAMEMMIKSLDQIGKGNIIGGVLRVPGAAFNLLPGSPGYVRWLFQSFIPTIKFNSYKNEMLKQSQKLKRALTDAEKIKIIKINNNIYGEMNERLFGRSGTTTTWLRLAFTAPGYAEGNFRTVLKGAGPKGGRSRDFILKSIIFTLVAASIATRLITGKWPDDPKNLEDLRNLFKIQTNDKDGNGDPVYYDLMTYDKDYWAILGNLLTGHPGDIPGAISKRLSGMVSTPARLGIDIAKLIATGSVTDYKDTPVFLKTDSFLEKTGKFLGYEAGQALPISASTFTSNRQKGQGMAESIASSELGIRATSSEKVLGLKKEISDIMNLQRSKKVEQIRLDKMYNENPQEADRQKDKYNAIIQKKLDSLHVNNLPTKVLKTLFVKAVHAPKEGTASKLKSILSEE